jgi:hypothetical protein
LFAVSLDDYTLLCQADGLPDLFDEYVRHALLAEQLQLADDGGKVCFAAVQQGGGWPFLVVAQRYSPAGGGFHPGVVLLPETGLLLLGAGERLLAYRLHPPARLWEDRAEAGFFCATRLSESQATMTCRSSCSTR